MTTVPSQHHSGRAAWGWALLAVAAFTLAVVLAIVSSKPCAQGVCASGVAGGPMGWFAIGALVLQGLHATVRAIRLTGGGRRP